MLETFGPLEPTASGALALNLPSGLRFTVVLGVGPIRGRVNAIEV